MAPVFFGDDPIASSSNAGAGRALFGDNGSWYEDEGPNGQQMFNDMADSRYRMIRARIMKEMMASSMTEQATLAMQPPAVIQLPPPTPKQPSPTVIDDPSASSIRFSLFGL
jgi:hypothetical protein